MIVSQILSTGAAAGLSASVAMATVINVEDNDDPGTPANGLCSLREAIDQINNAPVDTSGGDCETATGA